MTREEAIKRFQLMKKILSIPNSDAARTIEAIDMAIEALSADAVEVVRCRDCIHWFPHTQCGFDEDNDEYHDYCGLLIPDDDYYAYTRKPDDYCSYGERREDGEA